MCRIFGFIETNPKKVILDEMQEVLKPGGPDNYGYYIDKNIAIGHRRLSIIDLSNRANQPMEFDNLVVSYNGEVYNFEEIKKELNEYEFKTHSDTEVILKAYHKWGTRAFEKFRGMFAIAIWHKDIKKLVLVRDRVGVKPLYYYFDGKTFIFSSEIKAILKHPNFEKTVDSKSTILFFQLGFIPTPYSIFKNTYKLETGSILEFQNGKIKVEKFWDYLDFIKLPKIKKSEKEIEKELEVLLEESFNLRMVADVDVGVFLSGGVDSSLLASILSKNYKLNTFTIGFKDKRFNEADIAKKIAKHLNTNHTELYFDIKDMLDLLPKMIEIFDEPFGDSSMLPTFLVANLAKKSLKVALSADGGDELFWGYPANFKNAKRFKKFQKFLFLKRVLKYFDNRNVKKKYYMLENDFFKYKLATRYRVFPDEFKETFILDSFDYKCKSYLECAFLFDFRYFLTDDVLVKVDRVTMANSLEAREPFLDHKLIEYAFRLPDHLKYNNGVTKYILRKILSKYLPKDIVNLPKKGFSIPIKYWLRNELKREVLEVVSQKNFIDDIMDKEKIIDRFYKKGDRTNEIWNIYIYNLWWDRWMKK